MSLSALFSLWAFLALCALSTHASSPNPTAAWRQLIERHDMLRVVVLPDGRQQILEHVPPYQVQVLDLRGQDSKTIESQLGALRERMSHQVLPADQWPLFEIRATRLDDRITRLHFSFDLLVGDIQAFFGPLR